MAGQTKNFGFRKDSEEDYYSIDVVNDNLDKIDAAIKNVKTEAENKDGGNADMIDGMHADDFAKKNHTHNYAGSSSAGGAANSVKSPLTVQFNEIKKFEYDGSEDKVLNITPEDIKAFPTGFGRSMSGCTKTGYYNITGISAAKGDLPEQMHLINGVLTLDTGNFGQGGNDIVQMVFPCGGSGNIYVRAGLTEKGLGDYRQIAYTDHTHNKDEIEDFPTSLPANGGNADTVDGKHASDLQNYNNLSNKPASLPANGGTASTISNTLPVSKGGTGATTEIAALKNLGILNTAFNITENKPVGGMVFYESIADLGFMGAKTMAELFDAMPRNMSLCFRNVKNNSAYISDVPVDYAQIFCIKGAVTENYRYALAFGNNTNDHEIYYYSAESDGVKVNWRKINDGGNTSALNRKIKTFTVNLGSWYRLAHSKNSAANGVFTLSVDSSGKSTSFVFAVSQQHTINTGNQYKLNILSKSSFNVSVTKLRIVTKYGADDQYIDFYIEGGTANAEGEVDVQFFGKGWEVYNTIETCNVANGYTATEIQI